MFLAALFWSLVPLVIEISDAGNHTLVFFAIFGYGQSLGLGIFLYIFYRKFFNKSELYNFFQAMKGSWLNIEKKYGGKSNMYLQNFRNKYIFILAQIGRFGVLFYAWSTEYIDTAVAAIIFESWVIWLILLRRWDNNSQNRAGEVTTNKILRFGKQSYILLLFALIGLMFVQISQAGRLYGTINWGIGLALLGSFLDALNIERSLKFGENIACVELGENTIDEPKGKDTQLAHTILLLIITNFITGVVTSIIYCTQNIVNDLNVLQISNFPIEVLYWTAPFAVVFSAGSLILLRIANITATSLEINSIQYFTPIFALLWLLMFTQIDVIRPDLFAIGTVIVITANMLLNVHTGELRLGMKWIILSIWSAGVIVYFRDAWLGTTLEQDWLWGGSTDYFALLGLSTTVFILILSFRTLRLIERTRLEQQSAFSLYWKIRLLKGSDASELELIKTIDKSAPGEQLDKAKMQSLTLLSKPNENIPKLEQAEMIGELDALTHSKSQGHDTTEPMVLIAFSLITILLTLTTRPQFESWNGFVIDGFSVLFSATIIFLTLNLFDLRRERSESIFDEKHYPATDNAEKSSISTEKNITSVNLKSTWADIIMPIFLIILLLFVFGLLLYGKWLSDWSWAAEVAPTVGLTECLSICSAS